MKYFRIIILALLIPCTAFPIGEVGINIFTAIMNFKPNGAFQNATYVHKETKEKWDVAGNGFYFTAALNFIPFIKPALFFGRASLNEPIDQFNTYSKPTYSIIHYDYGFDLRIFPMRKYLFLRFGLLMGSSKHQLTLASEENIPLFDFKGRGYQAGFGLDVDLEGACFDYDCGVDLEYLVRKAWATSINVKNDSELGYDSSKKPSYREVMISVGLYFTY